MAKNGKKKKKWSPILAIIFVIALGVFLYAGYHLYTILHGYHASSSEYKSLESNYTKPYESAAGDGAWVEEVESNAEDAEPPLTVDWDELAAQNPDIVGWIYVDAFGDTISYPILHGTDNEYYLHHTFERQYLFAGSIFLNYENAADFADPHTIVYGHNMLDGSMFSKLKIFRDEPESVTENPYFWILTPDGNYRYRIFAVFDTDMRSTLFTLFSGHGSEFSNWANKEKENSIVESDIVIDERDYVLTLSTCTQASGPSRTVVMGKCVSTEKPSREK